MSNSAFFPVKRAGNHFASSQTTFRINSSTCQTPSYCFVWFRWSFCSFKWLNLSACCLGFAAVDSVQSAIHSPATWVNRNPEQTLRTAALFLVLLPICHAVHILVSSQSFASILLLHCRRVTKIHRSPLTYTVPTLSTDKQLHLSAHGENKITN